MTSCIINKFNTIPARSEGLESAHVTSEARTTTAEGRSVSQMVNRSMIRSGSLISIGTLSHVQASDARSEDYDGEAGVCLRWHHGSGNLLQPVTGRAKRGSDGRSPSLAIY